MADERLIFPIGFDLESGVKDATIEWKRVQRELQAAINSRPISIKADTRGLQEFETFVKRTYASLEDLQDLFPEVFKETKDGEGLTKRFEAMETSINAVNKEMRNLEKVWNNLSMEEKFDGEGQLTERAQELKRAYVELYQSQRTQGQTLQEITKEAINLANQEYEAKQRREKQEQEFNRLLNLEEKTLENIQAKQNAWRTKLSQTEIGSSDWSKAVEEVQRLDAKFKELQRSIKGVTTETKKTSSTKVDIDTSTFAGKLKDLENRWKALTAEQRKGAEGQALRAEWRKLSEEAGRYTSTLRSAVSAEDKATAAKQRGTKATQAQTSAYKTQSGYLQRLFQRMVAYASVTQAFSFLRNIREVTAQFELQRVALGSIIGDLNEANAMFEQIKAAAVKSPFRIKELVTYTKQLAAYKIETDELFETTQRLADISAGLGVGMERLVLAYGQIRATGYLRASEVRQLTEAGIPIVEELAKKMSELRGETVSAAEVMGLISERAISFGVVKEVFDDMTSAGGMFYKMQEKQAETLAGQWSNLQDSIAIMYEEIGNTALVNSSMKSLINVIKDMGTHWDFWLSIVQGGVTTFGLYYATQKKILPLYNAENKAIWAKIKAQKQLEAQNIRALAVGRQLTAHEQRRLTLTKHLQAADYERFIAEKKMTDAQLVRYAVSNRNNKQIMLAIRNTKRLTAEQLANIKSMNAWNAFTFKLGMSMRSLGASIKAIGASMLSFLPIAAIGAVISLVENFYAQSKERKKAIEDVNKATEQRTLELDRIEVAYRDVQKAASKANKEDEAFARQTYGDKIEQLQKIATMLKQYNLANAIDFSVITPENIDTVFDVWIEKLRNVNDLSQTFGIKLAEVANAQQGTIMGWSIFGENLKEDMQDLSESWADMVTNSKFRSELDRMRVYVDEMATTNEDFYKVLSDAVGEDAKIALSQKRRNESEYDYYMRIQDAYRKIRTTAMGAGSSVNTLNQALGGTYRAFHAIDTSEFESDLREVMHEFDKIKHTFENEDPLAIRMAIDEQFTINGWNEWQKDLVIRELNKERLKLNLELIPTVSSSKEGGVQTGIQSILNTEFKGLFSNDELEKITDPESAIKAIEAKVKGAVESIETLNKAAINATVENSKGGIEEIARLQAENNAELKKDEKDRNDDLIKTNRMQIAAIAAQTSAYEDMLQVKKDNAEADYNLAKSAEDMLLSQGLTDVAEDVKNTFGDLIVNELDAIKGNISEKFLISAKDLVGIKDIGDLYDLWAKQTKAITEEKTKLAEVGMDEATITAEQNRLETERANKQAQLAQVEQEIATIGYDALQQRYKQLQLDLASATTVKERKRIQSELDNLLADENYSKGASLSLTRSLLLAEIARGNAALEANQNTIDFLNSLPNLEKLWKDLGERWNFKLQDKGKKGGSDEDPWIILIKNRMSYMQDFQKGVENLSKFMANEAALQQEQLIMLNRGLSLNIDAKKLTGSREELLKWYDDAIKAVTDKIKNMGGRTWSGLGVEAILSKDTKSKTIKAYQQLLQELFNQKTDFQTKKLQEDMEKELKRLSDNISRTKTAKEFFDKMLGLTGDRELTATLTMSVYGEGGDLGKKLVEQTIAQLETAFEGVDISDAIDKTTGKVDYAKLAPLIEQLPEKAQANAQSLVDAGMKANADWLADLQKTYQKAFTFEERRTQVMEQEAQKRKEIEESKSLTPEQKAKFKKASEQSEARQIAAINLEEFKASDDYLKIFEDLDNIATPTIQRLMGEIKKFIETNKDLTPEQVKALMNEYEKLYNGFIERNPFEAITSGFDEFLAAHKKVAEARQNLDEARKSGDKSKIEEAEKDLTDALDEQRTALSKLRKGIQGTANLFSSAADQVNELATALGFSEDSDAVVFLQGMAKAFSFLAIAIGLAEVAMKLFDGAIKTFLATNPIGWILLIASAIVGALSMITNAKVRRAEREIERLQDHLDNLEYSFERLQKAQEKAFGSDYISNYEQRMANLQAQQEAYLKQADAERSKGKKADKNKIKEYEEQARATADEIKDMQSELSEHFLGTDLTSVARDFANAWIDAYKEFGNTTDAMKEKFQDMIQNMIVESFAAKVIQSALQPIFDSIDDMSKDGVLDMSDASKIADMTEVAVGNIDVGMTNLMNALSQAGISVRGMGSDLTGISKDIATASEESILGLAAGINTQNFYISQVPPKLDVIIGLLQGGNLTQGSAITLQDLVTLQNQHLSYLPSIAQHTADTVAECKQIVAETRRTADALERVIKPRGTQATHTLNATLN